MTRAEFVAEAKRRGYPKELVRQKFEALDAAGRFSDSPKPGLLPVNEPPAVPEQPAPSSPAPSNTAPSNPMETIGKIDEDRAKKMLEMIKRLRK